MESKSLRGQAITVHTPVLLKEVIHVLDIQPDDVVVDGTLGGGGHASALLTLLGKNGLYIGIDADSGALERVQQRLGEDERVKYMLGNFRNIDVHVENAGVKQVDKILLDIGLSSDQLGEESERGFSFLRDEPLKMTFSKDPKPGELTAWHVVNEWSEESLGDIIFGFGGEHRARRIARAICSAREQKEIHTSKRLADIVAEASPKRGPVHPATKTFQAIRMAVNDELGALSDALKKGETILKKGGRIAVITFHSLEDRIVKQTFAEWEHENIGERITKKPIAPSREEYVANRRARSAKLRCFKKHD